MSRITIELSPDADMVLAKAAKELHITKVEALRKALGLIWFILRNKEDGWRFFMEKGNARKEIVGL